MTRNLFVFVGAIAALAGCGGDTRGAPDAGFDRAGDAAASVMPMPRTDGAAAEADGGIEDFGPGACRATAECDDGISCTEDTCRFPRECEEGEDCIGHCRHVPVPARCGSGETCDVRHGCLPGEACNADDMCESDDPCMVVEGCDPAARVCVVVPLDGDGDGNRPRVCGGSDCDDSRDDVFWGAAEVCNGVDDDCDGLVDEEPNASDACGEVASCVEGSCQCDDEGLELCADGLCVDTSTDRDHCGSCFRSCDDEQLCTDGSCTACGYEGGPCCEGDTACRGHTECSAGTCEALACTLPHERVEERLLPRCSADTYDCITSGGDPSTCIADDSTPSEEGLDCDACLDQQIFACASESCPYYWKEANCCVEASCDDGDAECEDAECGTEVDAFWDCARRNRCFYVDEDHMRACFAA